MTYNPAQYYGVDIKCVSDADELFTEVTGVDCLTQDLLHRLTCDAVLGPNGDDWGYDCRRLIGANDDELKRMQSTISEVLSRDERVDSADVTLTSVATNGFVDIEVSATIYTALGSFEFTRTLSSMTDADLEGLQ